MPHFLRAWCWYLWNIQGFEDYWLLCCGLVYSPVSMCWCLYFLYQYVYVCVRLGVYTERSNALPSQISHPITHFNRAGEERGQAIFLLDPIILWNWAVLSPFCLFNHLPIYSCMTVLTLQLQDIAFLGSQQGSGSEFNPKFHSKTRSSSPQVVSGWVGGALINPAFSKLGREC